MIKNNSEIVANLGNLINRTLTFINKNYDSIIPEPKLDSRDNALLKDVQDAEILVSKFFDEIKLKDALKEIMRISKLCNQYFQECEPWKNPDMKDRKSTRLNSSHVSESRMPSSA